MTIRQTIEPVLTKLATLPSTTDGQTNLYVRMWNNQVEQTQSGELYDYQKPAVFLEVLNDQVYENIGEGYQQVDLVFRVHLVHEYFNQDGTFEQDLAVYDLRDSVIQLLSYFKPGSWCNALFKKSETQDYNHNNIYHYIIDFTCNFVDSAAVREYVESTPPTTLELQVSESQGGGQQFESKTFIINQ